MLEKTLELAHDAMKLIVRHEVVVPRAMLCAEVGCHRLDHTRASCGHFLIYNYSNRVLPGGTKKPLSCHGNVTLNDKMALTLVVLE